jgi:hypothetical protein
MRGPLELRLVLATLQDVRLGLHQLRLEASSCSAQELTAPDTEHPATGLACHSCWHGWGRRSLPDRAPVSTTRAPARDGYWRAADSPESSSWCPGGGDHGRFIRRFCGRNATRAARTAIEVAACQRRNDLVPDQIVFDLRIPVVARCSPTPPAR